MANTGMPQRDVAGGGPGGARNDSLGDLVSLAIRDASQLVKWEIDLAKLELRDDVKRIAISGAMLGMASIAGFLILTLLSFALAYGLITIGIWSWASFLIAAGAFLLVAGMAALIGVSKVRHLNGLRRTRASVQDGIALLRPGAAPGGARQPE